MIRGVFLVLGSLGVFLFGMRVMSEALQKLAGERFQSLLNAMTYNRFTSILTGLIITALIQSSSATTVILVGLVNAGLMSLTRAIGVIMGANIGTTFTAWIVSLVGFKMSITELAFPIIACSLPLLFNKTENRRQLGELLMGLGILFLGLQLLKDSVPDMRENIEVLAFFRELTGHGFLTILMSVVVGMVITIVLQSSSAAMTITITMAYRGWIDFPVAAGFVLGENIGTTITAYIASLGMSITARRAARSHLLFNLIGVTWMLIVFVPFTRMLEGLVPGPVDDPGSLPLRLSVFHTAFNVTNTCLLVWFLPQIARLVEILVPDRTGEQGEPYRLRLVSTPFPDFADVNLKLARRECAKLAGVVCDMLLLFLNAARATKKDIAKTAEAILAQDEQVNRISDEISRFLASCRSEILNDKQGASINAMLVTVSELRSIGTSCVSLVQAVRRKEKKKLKFHKNAWEELVDYAAEVLDFLKYNSDFLNQELLSHDLDLARKMEQAINDKRKRLRKLSQNKMSRGADIQGELVYLEIVKHLEHIGDFSLTIAHSLKEL